MVEQRRNNDRRRNNHKRRERSGLDKKALGIRRVAKVTKGGKRLRFSTVVVVGDRNGKVGVGLGRGSDVRSSIEKGERTATKAAAQIELVGDTIPHEVIYKYGAAKVMLRPAKPGTGIIAGSSVRTVLELAGVENVYGKVLGTNEPNANAYCTFEALKSLRKARVLNKMGKMRDRVEMKKEADKELKEKQAKKRAEYKKGKAAERKAEAKKRAPKKDVKKTAPKKEAKKAEPKKETVKKEETKVSDKK